MENLGLIISAISVTFANQILYLGHSTDITFLRKTDNYVLSMDRLYNWTLWEFQKKEPILNGTSHYTVDMQKNTMVVKKANAFDIYNLPYTSAVQVPYAGSAIEFKVTSNGEYIWAKSTNELRIWDRYGAPKLTIAGNYNNSAVAYDNFNLYISTTGKDTILVYSIPSFQSQAPITFVGSFGCWLTEGNKFLSTQGGIVRAYSVNGSNEGPFDIGDASGLSGYGSYFWTSSIGTKSLKMYRIGSSTPFLTLENGGNLIEGTDFLASYYNDTLAIYKLGTDSITFYKHPKITLALGPITSDTAGHWVAGNSSGVLIYGQVSGLSSISALNHGAISCITGTPNNKFAISTASGKIFSYDLSSGKPIPIDTLDYRSTKIKFTKDGTKLFAQGYYNQYYDNELIKFNYPSNQILQKWLYPNVDSSFIIGFSISDNGSIVSQTSKDFHNGRWINNSTITYIDSNKLTHITNGSDNSVLQLSPSGKYSILQCDSILKIYKDSVLINAFSGKFGGWFDDSTIVLNKYKMDCSGVSCFPDWKSTQLYSVRGNSVSGFAFPEEMFHIQMISDSVVYYNSREEISPFSSFRLANIIQGKVLYPIFDSTEWHYSAFPIGSTYLVYQTHTSLGWLKWNDVLPARSRMISDAIHFNEVNLSILNNKINLKFALSRMESPELNIVALNGKLIAKISLGKLKAGNYNITLPIHHICANIGKNSVIAIIKSQSLSYASKLIL